MCKRKKNRFKNILSLAVIALALGAAADPAWDVRAVQLDLARQMETVPFLKRYLSVAKESGYTAVVLYLEGRVRTPSFPYRSREESYSVEEMKEVVAEAQRVGIDVVPVVSVLGHAEKFFGFPEMDSLCEERDNIGRFKRLGNKHGTFAGKMTFCHSLPETRAFLERYLGELCDIFPGKNFHVGLDESFNTGFCALCSKRMKTEGLGGLYCEVIRWAHDFLAKRGKRMWMWDDFFEFFPEKIPTVPRDIVMCNWEYNRDASPNRGQYGHFGERFRCNNFEWYRKLGIPVLACPGRYLENIETVMRSAEGKGVAGGYFTQWEMQDCFHALFLPSMRATGRWWCRGTSAVSFSQMLDESIASFYPTLVPDERKAVKAAQGVLAQAYGGTADLAYFSAAKPTRARLDTLQLVFDLLGRSKLAQVRAEPVVADPFDERAMFDDLMCVIEINLLCERLREIVPQMVGLKRRPEMVRRLKSEAEALRPALERLKARRLAQQAAWRANCRPNNMEAAPAGLLSALDQIAALPESPAAADEWQLEMCFQVPDYHGIVIWNVYGLYDGKWEPLKTNGRWKPSLGDAEFSYFERTVPLRRDRAPSALKVEYRGYGEGGLAFVSVANREGRLVPASVKVTSGLVRDPSNILEDTTAAAYFGDPRCRAQMLDPTRADIVSTVEISLKPEFD